MDKIRVDGVGSRGKVQFMAEDALEAARLEGCRRLLYTSSACVYPGYLQDKPDVTPLREEDAYPADPEDGYGWEKLFTERMCRHYREDFGLDTRVARFHKNGPVEAFWRPVPRRPLGGRGYRTLASCLYRLYI